MRPLGADRPTADPVKLESIAFASTPSGRIAFRISEPREPVGHPEPVLLIMGLAGSGRMWFRLVPHLAERHRVIVFDNRGTGESSRVRGPLTMSDLVADALAVLDRAGLDRVHVLGASMGGMVAQHLALDHRGRVRSLMLACTTAGGRRGAPNLRLVAATMLRPMVGPRRTFGLVAPALYSRRTIEEHPDRLRDDLRRRASDRVGALTSWAQMSAIAGHDTRGRLSELAGLPTLVIHGTEDRIVPVTQGRELARGIPGARLVEVAGAGHLLVTDAEEEVSGEVLGHLRRQAPLASTR